MIATLPDGRRVSYDDTGGDGEAVLFLHGFPHGRGLWRAPLERLGDAYRCVAPDFPGFGDADLHPAPSVDAYADDVAGLLDALAIERAAVVGLSMGGYVALALWRRHPARVRALVLADTRAAPDDGATRARRGELAALVRGRGLAALAEAQLPGALGATSRASRPDVVASLRALMTASGSADGMVAALAAMRDRPDATASLAAVAVPTLVLVGAEDAITRPSEMRAVHDAIAGSTMVVIPDAGHVSVWERPDEFTDALREFLGGIRRRSDDDRSGG